MVLIFTVTTSEDIQPHLEPRLVNTSHVNGVIKNVGIFQVNNLRVPNLTLSASQEVTRVGFVSTKPLRMSLRYIVNTSLESQIRITGYTIRN